jgi:hypothetical protein
MFVLDPIGYGVAPKWAALRAALSLNQLIYSTRHFQHCSRAILASRLLSLAVPRRSHDSAASVFQPWSTMSLMGWKHVHARQGFRYADSIEVVGGPSCLRAARTDLQDSRWCCASLLLNR